MFPRTELLSLRSLAALFLAAGIVVTSCTHAAAQKNKPKLPPLKTPEEKMQFLEYIRLNMPTRRVAGNISFTSSDLDKQLQIKIGLSSSAYTGIIDDERFVRRAFLDLTGVPPTADQVRKFVENPSRGKRSDLIDYLLETDEYSRKWARYWREVIFWDSPAAGGNVNPQALEDWLANEFKNNVRWDNIVAQLVSASPTYNKDERDNKNQWGQKTGQNNFVLACDRKPEELASQTARIFMGISINCAECHDHPFDSWKREQFHELAAFFSSGNYYMTDQNDPSEKIKMSPKFLLGEVDPAAFADKADARRSYLAAALIYNPDNYWFARAYVNRMWNELIGDGFYSVDSLGPDQDCVYQSVVNRIAAVFRYKDFDPKWLFRLIMNSQTYQRDIRDLSQPEYLFTAVRPERLRPEDIAETLEQVVGEDGRLAQEVEKTFKMNPSVPQSDLEGSIQQALLMMNNTRLQQKLTSGPVKKRLEGIKSDRDMVQELYLSILSRRPSNDELNRSLNYLHDVKNRNEAIDDLLWVLTNSTEFVTNR